MDPRTFDQGRTDGLDALRTCIPAAPPDYLRGALENPALGPEEAVLLLRNRRLSAGAIQRIARDQRWVRHYDVKLALAKHPRAPHALARVMLVHLFWRDLLDLAGDSQVAAPLRRDADKQLIARLEGLSLGEKIALARRAGPDVIAALRVTPDAMVLSALLGNPRFVERDAVALASAEATPPDALSLLAARDPWGTRLQVRLALLANPRTPVAVSLRLVENLSAEDLARLAHDAAAPRIVRVGAERRLERLGRGARDLGFG